MLNKCFGAIWRYWPTMSEHTARCSSTLTDVPLLHILSQIPCRCRENSLWWRHNGCDSVSNQQPQDCFTQPFIQTQIKENIKAPRHWPLWGIHWRPVNSPHKWPVTRKMFPFDDVIMLSSGQSYQAHWFVDFASGEIHNFGLKVWSSLASHMGVYWI